MRGSLARHRYQEPPEVLSVDGVDGSVLTTPRRMMVRYVSGAIARAVDEWCQKMRCEQGAAVDADQRAAERARSLIADC